MIIIDALRQVKQQCVNFVFMHLPKMMTDKQYLSVLYRYIMSQEMNWDNPKSFNEKLQWLKVYDRNPEYSTMVDKYAVKKYVADRIGVEYIIPIFGVWKSFDDIDFSTLPDQFVLKCTHDSGGYVICRDKSSFDIESARKKITHNLKRNFYYVSREWPYKKVKPRVMAEKFMVDSKSPFLTDYKFFCFDGEPKIMYCSKDGSTETKTDFFDMDYNHLDMRMKDPNDDVVPPKPVCFDEMKKLAGQLSKGIPHVRVDFYEIDGKVYFGEFTFYHNGGWSPVYPSSMGLTMGDWIHLPKK